MRMLRAGLWGPLAGSLPHHLAVGWAQARDVAQGLWDQVYLGQVPEELTDLQDGHQDDQGRDDTGYLRGRRAGGQG